MARFQVAWLLHWRTSKMSMEGWWMVQTTVLPVSTVLRTVLQSDTLETKWSAQLDTFIQYSRQEDAGLTS